MFKSFSGSWGSVAVIDDEANSGIFVGFIEDKFEILRGLLVSCHFLRGTVVWETFIDTKMTLLKIGTVSYKSTLCPGEEATKTQRNTAILSHSMTTMSKGAYGSTSRGAV